MSSEAEDRRLTVLEQQMVHMVPLFRDHMQKTEDKLDRLTTALVELAEQSKRLPHIDHEMQVLRDDIHKLRSRAHIVERRQDAADDVVKELLQEVKLIRTDVQSNTIHKTIFNAGCAVVLTGGVGTIFYVIQQVIIR